MKQEQLKELLLQSLEHERGGVKVYETALRCVINDDLKEEWTRYLSQTRNHVTILTEVCQKLSIDPQQMTPGREVVSFVGHSLVQAMEKALKAGKPEAAEIVACECVTLAETKDHADWQLIQKCASNSSGEQKSVLTEAADQVEDEEDEHLYHTRGWARELWLQSLGIKAVLPPPEEREHVTTAISAARAEHGRDKMTSRRS